MTDVIFKNDLTNMFQLSVVYHRRRLREIFRKYYNPLEKNSVWTKDIPEQLLHDLRLHLSWDLGLRMFHLNREQIGTRIIYRFKELGIFLFLKKVIRDEKNM